MMHRNQVMKIQEKNVFLVACDKQPEMTKRSVKDVEFVLSMFQRMFPDELFFIHFSILPDRNDFKRNI